MDSEIDVADWLPDGQGGWQLKSATSDERSLFQRIVDLENRRPNSWHFHIVRDAQGLISDVTAVPIA